MESKERERIQEGNYPNISNYWEKKFYLILMEILRMSKFTKFIRTNIIVYFILV